MQDIYLSEDGASTFRSLFFPDAEMYQGRAICLNQVVAVGPVVKGRALQSTKHQVVKTYGFHVETKCGTYSVFRDSRPDLKQIRESLLIALEHYNANWEVTLK